MGDMTALGISIKLTDLASQGFSKIVERLKGLSAQSDATEKRFKNLATSFKGLAIMGGADFAFAKSVMPAIEASAKLDKSLTMLKQTAGATSGEVAAFRSQLFAMARQTGQNIDDLKNGADALIAGGMSFSQMLPTMNGINEAMAVTGANAETLAGALGVVSANFKFDLSQVGMAANLLDKMTVAGRLGNAELEDLSALMPTIATGAKMSGFNFDQTLAFTEQMSKIERDPSRLGTLVASTLRVFTNGQYRKTAEKATGVKYFDDAGGQRSPVEVIRDLQEKFSQLKTDEMRASFISAAFGQTDQDTQKGSITLLGDKGALPALAELTKQISSSTGTISRDLPEALANSVDQMARMRAEIALTGDEVGKSFNSWLSPMMKQVLDAKEKSFGNKGAGNAVTGLGIGLAAGTAAAALAVIVSGFKFLPGMTKGILGGGVGLGAGKAIAEAAGVNPVFITGIAPGVTLGGGGGIPGGVPAIITQGATVASASALSSFLMPVAGAVLLALAPVAVAAVGSLAMLKVLDMASNTTSGGAYDSWEEAIYDKLNGGTIKSNYDKTIHSEKTAKMISDDKARGGVLTGAKIVNNINLDGKTIASHMVRLDFGKTVSDNTLTPKAVY